jgi:hypothetical protein
MVSVYEVADWNDVALFAVWTLAVCALAKAAFGSFPAAEMQWRLSQWDSPRRALLTRLNWEVAKGVHWSADIARGKPDAVDAPLTADELEARRRELLALTRRSVWWRAGQYLMHCWACQTFWTAVAVFAVTRGVADLGGLIFSAAAYSGAAVLLSMRGMPGPAPDDRVAGRAPAHCKNGGGH